MILLKPPKAFCMLALAHGAGAGMRHAFMEALAQALFAEGVATLRYDFPYMAAEKGRIDAAEVLEATVREAVTAAAKHRLPLFAGGKSMGGRMTTQAQAQEPMPGLKGIALFGFPLHLAKKPSTKRADHLPGVTVPMLFLQGTRDELAPLPLLQPVLRKLPNATLHIVEGADHGFHVLKRSGRTGEEVLRELAVTFAEWARARL